MIGPESEEVRSKRKKVNRIVCNRCHHLTHYTGAKSDVPNIELDDFHALLAKEFHAANGGKHVVIKMLDFFDLAGSVIPNFQVIELYFTIIMQEYRYSA